MDSVGAFSFIWEIDLFIYRPFHRSFAFPGTSCCLGPLASLSFSSFLYMCPSFTLGVKLGLGIFSHENQTPQYASTDSLLKEVSPVCDSL